MMKDGTRGLIHSLSAPPKQHTAGPEMTQLNQLMGNLSSQVDQLASSQRQSHSIIVTTSQPTSIFGYPLWKVAGLAGVAGYAYFYISGYELRDLVYVSKKHFDVATAALKDQYDQLEIAVAHVKGELLNRIGLVDQKLDDMSEAIHGTVRMEIGKVDERMAGLARGVSQMDARLAATGLRIDGIASDMAAVKQGLQTISSELDARLQPIHANMDRYHEEAARAQSALCLEMGTMQVKIDELSRATGSLYSGLDRQSRGISLLVEFARRSSTASPDLAEAFQSYATQDTAAAADVPPAKAPARMARKPSQGLAVAKQLVST